MDNTIKALKEMGADVYFHWVEGGEHNEATWEKQIPVFMAYLGV